MQTKLIQWRSSSDHACKITVAGDFCPREINSDDVSGRSGEICEKISPYFSDSDLRILQWECAVTDKNTPIIKSGPNHRCFPSALNFADALNIDVALLANNHTGDYNAAGISDTLKAFADHNIKTIGAGMNKDEASSPLIVNRNGLRIGLLNAAEHEFGIADYDRPGVAGIDIFEMPSAIKTLKEKTDAVLVMLHGGHEMYSFPSPRLQKLCRFIADCGADAIFNCHSHCPCGYEVYNGVPIVYSPGNFYFPPRVGSLPCWYIGYVPKFYFDSSGAFALELLGYYNFPRQLQPLDGVEAENFFSYLDNLNSPLDDPRKLQSFFDAWCVISGINGYLKILQNVPEWEFKGKENITAWINIRNLFACESHHDLLRNTLSMIEFDKLDETESSIEIIRQMQNPKWVRMEL